MKTEETNKPMSAFDYLLQVSPGETSLRNDLQKYLVRGAVESLMQKYSDYTSDAYKQEIEELKKQNYYLKSGYDDLKRFLGNKDANLPDMLSAEKVKSVKLAEANSKLIQWHKKYPPGRIYSYSRAATIESELTAAVTDIFEALKDYESK